MTRALLTLLLCALPVLGQSPAAAVELAAADLARVRADRRPSTRYLSLYHLAADKQAVKQWDAVLRFWANSLSREPELVAPRVVAAGLWAVDLDDYRWDAAVWERLAQAEPWFTLQVVRVEPVYQEYGYWRGPGKTNWVKTEDRKVGEKKTTVADTAPWTPTREALYLREATGSAVPLVRADWWLYQTAVSADRKAGYYDWLGLGRKETDFQALVGADVAAAAKLRKQSFALIGRSGVTLQSRSLFRVPSLTGYYYATQDYQRSVAEKNPLRLLDGDITPDASEQIGTLPNGLLASWLQDGKGQRQDVAPDSIASDGKATGNDRRVHSGLCWRCHQAGLQPVNDWARKVYAPPFALEDALDYRRTKELRAKYLSDLAGAIRRDQDAYAETLRAVNGLTPLANSKAFAAAWDHYAERDRDADAVAAELGADGKTLLAALKTEAERLAKVGGKLDPLLAGVVQGVEVRVEHAEELVPLAHEIIGRHKP